MKQIKFFAMTIAVLTMFSCSKDQADQNLTPPVVEGIETYATFSFNVEGAKGKSITETDAGKTDSQDKVKSIIVTVFKVGTPSILEATGTFTDSEATGNLKGAPMKLTSGEKRIFVFANAAGLVTFPSLTEGTTTLEDCYDSMMKFDPFTLTTITDATGYFMSNARTASSLKVLLPNISADASKTATGDADAKAQFNNFSFVVQKGVSKVKAQLAAATTGDIYKNGVLEGQLSKMLFTVRNINVAVRPVQLFANKDITDTDAAKGEILPQAAYYNAFDPSTIDLTKKATFATMYSGLNDIDQTLDEKDITNAVAVLVTENTNAKQVYGNTSYLAVKGVYKPTQVVTACTYDANINDGTFVPALENGVEGADFWKVDFEGLLHLGDKDEAKLKNNLFSNNNAAVGLLTSVLAANGVTEQGAVAAILATRISQYKGGVAYYRLNIGVTPKEAGKPLPTIFGIKRNSIYSVKITKINKLGANDESDLDDNPETPVTSVDTYITATIKVADWVRLDQEGEL